MASEYDNCPNCGVSFQGEPLSQKHLDSGCYGDTTHWRREIGIDGGWIGIYDGIVAWKCPDCKHEFPRGKAKLWQEMFEKYKEATSDKDNG